MSLATLGAVAASGNDLPLPDTSALSVGECLILAGGGGTTEAVVIRSIARGRNIGVTVNRGALGTLPLAHAAPTTVSTYDPSGGGGGGGVTVDNGTDPPAAVTTLVAPGADVSVPGSATLVVFRQLGPFRVLFNDAGMEDGGVGKIIGDELPVGSMVLPIILLIEAWNAVAGSLTVDVWWEHGGGVGVPGRLNESLDSVATDGGYGEDTSSTGYPIQAAQSGVFPEKWTRIISSGVQLLVEYRQDSGIATLGKADIWVIIATPAS